MGSYTRSSTRTELPARRGHPRGVSCRAPRWLRMSCRLGGRNRTGAGSGPQGVLREGSMPVFRRTRLRFRPGYGRIACRRRRALAAPLPTARRPLEPENAGDSVCRQPVVGVRYDRVRLKLNGLHLAPAFGNRRGVEPFVGERMPDRSLGPAEPRAGPEGSMSAAKEELTRIVAEQPEDSTREELVRELDLRLMVRRGLDDADAGRTISNEEMRSGIRSWPDWDGLGKPSCGREISSSTWHLTPPRPRRALWKVSATMIRGGIGRCARGVVRMRFSPRGRRRRRTGGRCGPARSRAR